MDTLQIIEKDFKIEEGSDIGRYNLYFKTIINKGKENQREDWKIFGYDMRLPSILKHLTYHLTDTKIKEKYPDVITLKEYINELQITINYLQNLFKNETKGL